MKKYFDNQDEPQLEESAQTRWGPKAYDIVKDMDQVEFGKKKIQEEGTKKTRKRKRDKTEEAPPDVPAIPFKKKSIFFKYLSY